MPGMNAIYSMAAATQVWLGGQQVPLKHLEPVDNMRPSTISSAALVAATGVHALEDLNGVVCPFR